MLSVEVNEYAVNLGDHVRVKAHGYRDKFVLASTWTRHARYSKLIVEKGIVFLGIFRDEYVLV